MVVDFRRPHQTALPWFRAEPSRVACCRRARCGFLDGGASCKAKVCDCLRNLRIVLHRTSVESEDRVTPFQARLGGRPPLHDARHKRPFSSLEFDLLCDLLRHALDANAQTPGWPVPACCSSWRYLWATAVCSSCLRRAMFLHLSRACPIERYIIFRLPLRNQRGLPRYTQYILGEPSN